MLYGIELNFTCDPIEKFVLNPTKRLSINRLKEVHVIVKVGPVPHTQDLKHAMS